MQDPIWSPSAAQIQESNLYKFMQTINSEFKKNIQTYDELYQWSIANPEAFWQSIWHFSPLKYKTKWSSILKANPKMLSSTWFEGAKLNFAENFLQYKNGNTAIYFANENGERRNLTFNELYNQVASVANYFLELNINAHRY